MTKQEIYAWSSISSSLVLLGFYLVATFGWPESLEGYADDITGIFWKVLGIAIAVEVILEVLKEFRIGEVHKDERDTRIESKGYRNAYYMLMVALVSLVVHLLLNNLIGSTAGEEVFLTISFMTVHILVVILFMANVTKSATQLYFYSKY